MNFELGFQFDKHIIVGEEFSEKLMRLLLESAKLDNFDLVTSVDLKNYTIYYISKFFIV